MPVSTSIIEQSPLYSVLPVGQEIILVVSNNDAVANESKVKFIAEVHVSAEQPPVLGTTANLIGTFKTTPNNAGVGIFDFRNILENYVKADSLAADGSSYKTTATSSSTRHPMHLIDKYSTNQNTLRFMAIRFAVEYLGATDNAGNQSDNIVRTQAGTERDSINYSIFNGYLKYADILTMGIGAAINNFGFTLTEFFPSSSARKFLTNAPTTQYANLEDYGTLAYLVDPQAIGFSNIVTKIVLTYYNSAGASIGTEDVNRLTSTGAFDSYSAKAKNGLLYFGCFPGNLQNWSRTFNALVTAGTIQGGYYTVQAFGTLGGKTAIYTIDLNCPDLKNYESIRLCWLNQWGAWDYYTFTKKSTKSLSTKGSTYTQLEGTWNESVYRLDGFKGGKKSFRVNANEKISMNTNFVSEDDNVMFEELINSPEVYLLEGYQTDASRSALNQYVTPVRLTTSKFTTKTIANNKLMQYSFEIEKSKTLRTQSI